MRTSKPIKFAQLLTCGLTAILGGCIAPQIASDQGQVDPIVKSSHPMMGQPLPLLPDCTAQQWVQAASGSINVSCSLVDIEGNKNKSAEPQSVSIATTASVSPESKRTVVQAELMTYADQMCDAHLARIYGTSAGTNFELGWLTTLLSGGAALASGHRAAQNLAGGSALFSGTRSLFNSEFYQGYLGTAVMTEIIGLRSGLREKIAAKRVCSLNSYPPAEAIGDALEYHNACSFSTGLASLLNKAGISRVGAGADKLRAAQANAIKAQLDDYGKQIDTLTKKDKLTPGETAQLSYLQKQVASLQALQRFSDEVDPKAAETDQQDSARKELLDKMTQLKDSLASDKPENSNKDQLITELKSKIDELKIAASDVTSACTQLPPVISH